jgi:hypothetical protein
VVFQIVEVSRCGLEVHIYGRNVIDVDWGLVVRLALTAKVTRRAYKVSGLQINIYLE